MAHHLMCEPGDQVVIRAVPQDHEDAKIAQTVISMVATIAAALAPAYAPWIMLGAAAINVGLSLAFPPPSPSVPHPGTPRGALESAATLVGSRNRLMPYGAIPVVIGESHRHFPPLAAAPYTETVGGEQFIRLVYMIHHGRCTFPIEEVMIGQNPLSTYADIETEVRNGYTAQEGSDLFSLDVTENVVDHNLNADDHTIGEWREYGTTPDATEFSMDLTAPGGLLAITSNGSMIGYTIRLRCEYRTNLVASSWLPVEPELASGVGMSLTPSDTFEITQSARGRMHRGIRFTFPVVYQDGYFVRIRIESEGADSGAYGTYSNWVTDLNVSRFRSIKPGVLFAGDLEHVSTLALRIRASDQFNGMIDTLSVMAYPEVAEWDSVTGWSDKAGVPYWVNEPEAAWHYANLIRGYPCKAPVDDAIIDHENLNNWRNYANANQWEVSGVIATQEQTQYWMEQIAATSRAIPSRIDGKFGVIFDQPFTNPAQLICDRNSRNARGRLSIEDQPHAVRVRFQDKDSNYQVVEREVPWDGYNVRQDDMGPTPATEFVDLPFWGISDAATARKHGRYHLAAGRLRPRVIMRDMDFEHLRCNRGDMVLYQDRASLLGTESCRIATEPAVDGTLRTFDVDTAPFISFNGTESYLMIVRKSDGLIEVTAAPIIWSGHPADPYLREITIDTAGFDPVTEVAQGDLVAFVTEDAGVTEMVVVGIHHADGLTATVTMMDHAPAIGDADSGPVPPWDPGLSAPVVRDAELPLPPIITGVVSDETAMTWDAGGSLVARILVSFQLADSGPVADRIVGQYRLINEDDNDITHPWKNPSEVSPHNGQIAFFPIEDGALYDLRIRAESEGKPSEWQLWGRHRAVGRSTPPPTPENLNINPSNVITWDMPAEPVDLAGYLLRFKMGGGTPKWSQGQPAHGGILTERDHPLSKFPNIHRSVEITLMVKAIDVAGNESGDPDNPAGTGFAWVVTTLTDGILPNVIWQQVVNPAWTGSKIDCTIDGSGFLVANAEVNLFWTGNDNELFYKPDGDLFWADKYLRMSFQSLFVCGAAGDMALTIDADGEFEVLYSINFGPTLKWPGSLAVGPGDVFIYNIQIPAGTTQGVIRSLSWDIDVDDKREKLFGFVSLGAPGGDVVAPVGTFYAITQVITTLRAQAAPLPAAQAFYCTVHNFGAGGGPWPPGGPLIEWFDVLSATAPAGTVFDVEFIGY